MQRNTLTRGLAGIALLGGTLAAVPASSWLQSVVWEAQLRPNSSSSFIGGRSSLGPTSAGDSIVVSIMVTGVDTATPLAWQVRANECGTTTGERLAAVSKFPAIKASRTTADPSSPVSGAASVVLPIKMPKDGKYSVSLYASAKDTTIAIACGDYGPAPKELKEEIKEVLE